MDVRAGMGCQSVGDITLAPEVSSSRKEGMDDATSNE